ncbi:hypothetical protein MC885_014083 [Smutsia gigantea]|nr:hypothetical protein MC885_014083 [Smutsia gigantea]
MGSDVRELHGPSPPTLAQVRILAPAGGEVVASSIAVAEQPRDAEAKGEYIRMVWSEDWSTNILQPSSYYGTSVALRKGALWRQIGSAGLWVSLPELGSHLTRMCEVLGLLVWTLIAGTEYFRVPAFGWVMFVAVFYWVLTVFFLIVYITMTYTRIPQVPWTTVGLCFNGSAFLLYLSAAIVDASSVSPERDSHDFNSWAASSFFAFLVTICYAGNTYFSFIAWRSRTIQ